MDQRILDQLELSDPNLPKWVDVKNLEESAIELKKGLEITL